MKKQYALVYYEQYYAYYEQHKIVSNAEAIKIMVGSLKLCIKECKKRGFMYAVVEDFNGYSVNANYVQQIYPELILNSIELQKENMKNILCI